MSIRINGIDAPEMKSHCKKERILAIASKEATVLMLRSAHTIEIRNIKRGKYFRLIADVYADGVSIGRELIRRHLAVPYYGKTKINWCK